VGRLFQTAPRFQRGLPAGRVTRFQSLLIAIASGAWAFIFARTFWQYCGCDPLYGALPFVVVTMLLPVVLTGEHA
jgi:hypothetical protein